MVEATIRTIGVLLLLGVLMLSILIYSNVAGVGTVLEGVKEGVDKLVGWFIPKKTNVTITVKEYPNVNYTTNGNKVVINANLSAGATYTDLVKITVVTDKEATLVLKVSNGLDINLPFTVTATKAIIDTNSFTVNAGATVTQKITIYPTDTATVVVDLDITATAETSGTVVIEVVLSYLK